MNKLCLNMIVKNETKVILRSLESVVDYISCYIIVDTGSTDDTMKKITTFFEAHQIPGTVVESEFINFEHARNTALKLAQRSRLAFDYILLMDADMSLQVTDPTFLNALTHDVYSVEQRNTTLSYFNIRLLKKNIPAHYVGVTHEYVHHQGRSERLKSIFFNDYTDGANRFEKQKRDIRLLKEGLRAEPDNARYLFYLAQTYFDTKDYDLAKNFYQQRIKAGGWAEETFYAYYRSGLCELYGNPDARLFVHIFLETHAFRPHRAEPLYELARYYRGIQQYATAYLFAKAASQIPYPKSDRLFIEATMYHYRIDDELSICAFWVGNYRESYDLGMKLLANTYVPESDKARLHQNMTYARDKL